MKVIYLILLILSISISKTNARNTNSEIEQLLIFVENPKCQFERNGDMYSGIEAIKHIQKKHHYYEDDIKTAEDFIEYSATKSKLSGKYYKIHCKEMPIIKSKSWLLEELKKIRIKRLTTKVKRFE
ncbi:MAG: hypothetical protein COB38_05895 [Gammaproteobacteria bacterium]|nr:MAG: hypothetical protein COB38_05895 [Gammaproteobacteria bacterium]